MIDALLIFLYAAGLIFAFAAGMRKLVALVVLMLVIVWASLASAGDDAACAHHLPYGPPLHPTARTTMVCHPGYAAAHDDDYLIPRWIAYRLTGAQTMGCEKRRNNFHAERTLPKDRRASPADYAASGYDKGHMAPAADFVHDAAQMSDSFSMVNMAPQLPGLNRQQWERLEETGRAWAWARGEVLIYVGPVMSLEPKTIGKNKVGIPQAFWKVLVDPFTAEAVALAMPQRAIPKGDLEPWQTSISNVERGAQISLGMPDTIDRRGKPELWPADRKGWNAERRVACAQ